MSRHNSSGSYRHHIRIASARHDEYVVSWTVDYYYSGTRGRFPRTTSRDTDRKGAERFAKKWGIQMPGAVDTPAKP